MTKGPGPRAEWTEWLVEQGGIKTLDCDRQPLEDKQPFSAVTRHFTHFAAFLMI